MKSLCHNTPLKFVRWSRRKLPKGSREMLLVCECGQKHQAREGAYSYPYIVKRKSVFETKEISGTYRITKTREAEILSVFKSVQEYLDIGKVL